MPALRIALIAPPWFSIPPIGYGGIEWVVSLLADGLAARGHDVTLFASGGSRSPATIDSFYREPPSRELGNVMVELPHLLQAYNKSRSFDVIHDHTTVGLLAASQVSRPVCHTLHGPITPAVGDICRLVSDHVQLISISRHQCSTLPAGCPAVVIPNGIDFARFPFDARGGDYLLFVGRMTPDKGILDAIEIARRTRLPLLVLAKVNEAAEREYFETKVRPALAGVDVDWREQVSHEEKVGAYQHALVTLFPIHWPEPFGLVMVESMATGTPVIAYPRGAAPEVIVHGKTGFLVNSIDDAVAAAGEAASLDRQACRQHVERTFSAEQNVRLHEELYRLLASS